MRTVVLLDNHQGGHHLTYLRLYSQTLLELGCKVIVLSPEPAAVRTWVDDCIPQVADRLHAFYISNVKVPRNPFTGKKLPQPWVVFTRWLEAAAAIRRAAYLVGSTPDLVFFNWFDSYCSYYLPHHVVDRIFPYPWSGLYFQPGDLRFRPHTLPLTNLSLAHYIVARSPRCRALAVLDETQTVQIERELGKTAIAFPDIADDVPPDKTYPPIQQIQEKAKGRTIIGVIGSLSKRKGILTLLEVARQFAAEDWFFVFAGKLSRAGWSAEEFAYLQEVASSPPSNCFFHLERIPEEPQFNGLIDSFDILFAAYENYPYSSNILNKAAIFQKPVIASKGFCMGARVERLGIGQTVTERDVAGCAIAIRQICQQIQGGDRSLETCFQAYRSEHSIHRLRYIFASMLDLDSSNLSDVTLGDRLHPVALANSV